MNQYASTPETIRKKCSFVLHIIPCHNLRLFRSHHTLQSDEADRLKRFRTIGHMGALRRIQELCLIYSFTWQHLWRVNAFAKKSFKYECVHVRSLFSAPSTRRRLHVLCPELAPCTPHQWYTEAHSREGGNSDNEDTDVDDGLADVKVKLLGHDDEPKGIISRT